MAYRFLVLCKQSFCCFFSIKTPRFADRKWHCIDLILRHLRSTNRGSFHAKNNSKNFIYRALGLFLLLFLTVSNSQAQAYSFPWYPGCSWLDHDVQVAVGWRHDNFKWHLNATELIIPPEPFFPGTEAISHTNFKKMDMVVVEFNDRFMYDRCFYGRLNSSYAWGNESKAFERLVFDVPIFTQGTSALQEKDTFVSSFSSRNHLNKNVEWDVSLGGGYPVYACPNFMFAGLVGYSYSRQDIHVNDENNIGVLLPGNLPPGVPVGPIPTCSVVNKYTAIWYGPWIGVDTVWIIDNDWSFATCWEYHWAWCQRRQKTHTGFEEFDKYEHKSFGRMFKAEAEIDYDLWCDWYLGIKGNYRRCVSGSNRTDRIATYAWGAFALIGRYY